MNTSIPSIYSPPAFAYEWISVDPQTGSIQRLFAEDHITTEYDGVARFLDPVNRLEFAYLPSEPVGSIYPIGVNIDRHAKTFNGSSFSYFFRTGNYDTAGKRIVGVEGPDPYHLSFKYWNTQKLGDVGQIGEIEPYGGPIAKVAAFDSENRLLTLPIDVDGHKFRLMTVDVATGKILYSPVIPDSDYFKGVPLALAYGSA